MSIIHLFRETEPMSLLFKTKLLVPFIMLALFWVWESRRPFFDQCDGRLRHAKRNIILAVVNAVTLALVFSAATAAVTHWTSQHQMGLLNVVDVGKFVTFGLAIVLLDGWMYVWHRANHLLPILWRFHRMHHSDTQMDVTTATRFHIGEHVVAVVLRLGSIPILGFELWHIAAYELLVIVSTQFQHANISLGLLDRWLRAAIVTPDMHKIHHSRWKPETDSNYSTVFSFWDRLACTFRMRSDPRTIEFGLDNLDEPQWQTFTGMLRTPFVILAAPSDFSSNVAHLGRENTEPER
jgi:sterol desaturase/sphingolipid hydroxylase (fatty acid hydroxylase superfamily)